MSIPRELFELWTRFLSETFRRVPPQRILRMAPEMPKLFEQWLETGYKTSGFVPRSRYLNALEENDRLRRRVAELEAKLKWKSSDSRSGAGAAETPTAALEGAFDEMLTAQRRWLQMWMPRSPKQTDD